MTARGFGLPCPACGHLYSRVIEVRGDMLDERQPRVIRVRACRSCAASFETVELSRPPSGRVRIPDPRRRLSQLRSLRRKPARGLMPRD